MASDTYRYALDPTGSNRDNYVSAEKHTLELKDFRAISPDHGPFYSKSLIVVDANTNKVLVKDVDYFCTELLQEVSLKYGLEILSLIIITNTAVSGNVTISYQALGGQYQNAAKAVANLYNTVINDNRTVAWENVVNKPNYYPPNQHFNLLADIVGFEPLITSIERLRNAIILSDVPAWEALVEWVKLYVKDRVVVTEDPAFIELASRITLLEQKFTIVNPSEVDDVTKSDALVSFNRLLQAAERLNFNALTITPMVAKYKPGLSVEFTVQATHLADGERLYWSVEHIDTVDSDFNILSGVMTFTAGKASFNLPITSNIEGELTERFKVYIRRTSVTGAVIAQTGTFTLTGIPVTPGTDTNDTTIARAFLACCYYTPGLVRNARNMYIIGGKHAHQGIK